MSKNRFLAGMSSRRVGFLDNENDPEVRPDAPVEPAADSLETDLLEISDSQGDIADKEDEISEAVDVTEGLEEYRSQMRVALENGGLSRDAALVMQYATRRELQRVNQHTNLLVGQEHFGGASSKFESTQLGMETIGEKIKEIWQKILAQLNRAYEWFRNHMLKVFGAGEKLTKRATALKKAAEDNSVAKAKETKIKRPALVKALHDGTGSGADCAKVGTLENMTTVGDLVADVWPKLIGTAGDNIAKVFEEVADNKTDGKIKLFDQGEAHKVFSQNGDLDKMGQEARTGTTAKVTPVMPGGIVGLAFIASTDDVAAQSKQKVLMVPANKDFKVGSNEELNTLGKSDIVKVAESVEKLGGYLAAYRKEDNKFKPIEERVKKAAKRVGELVGKEKDAGDTRTDDQLRAIQQLAQAAPDLMTGFPTKFYTFAVDKAKGYLDYAELSLAQYKA